MFLRDVCEYNSHFAAYVSWLARVWRRDLICQNACKLLFWITLKTYELQVRMDKASRNGRDTYSNMHIAVFNSVHFASILLNSQD